MLEEEFEGARALRASVQRYSYNKCLLLKKTFHLKLLPIS
jgi:hypothetical protein